MIAGYRANLTGFFKSYLTALSKGEPPEDVYKAVEERIQKGKITKMIKQAFLLLVNGNCDLAGTMYKKAVEKDPENNDAQLGLGYSLLFSDKIDESLAYFTELKSKNENKRVLLGYHLSRATKTPTDEILAQVAESAQLEPQFFFAAYRAGEILDKAGKCEESKAVYRHAYKVLLRHLRRNK
jgi:tetratricopeptide (TPR) repeat protein